MKTLEEKINYTFKNKDLLKEALTHSSYANDCQLGYNNERMEFLGDAVLSLVSAQYLYERYPNWPEGDLSKLRSSLVCTQSLSDFAREIDLGDYLLLGRGELKTAATEVLIWKMPLRLLLPPYILTAEWSRRENTFCAFCQRT